MTIPSPSQAPALSSILGLFYAFSAHSLGTFSLFYDYEFDVYANDSQAYICSSFYFSLYTQLSVANIQLDCYRHSSLINIQIRLQLLEDRIQPWDFINCHPLYSYCVLWIPLWNIYCNESWLSVSSVNLLLDCKFSAGQKFWPNRPCISSLR